MNVCESTCLRQTSLILVQRNMTNFAVLLKIQGVAKKKSPLQKWLTWFIRTMNKENVNESCVFVLT